MTAQEIRQKYIDFFVERGHVEIPRALLVPQEDPTTLFTGSGMQPLIPYLLGEKHPDGKRLVDSQTCLRAEDMDEVGDNRHTTFFEMLGNWSLGDYGKEQQLAWFFEFLTKEIGLDPKKLYATVFIGDKKNNLPKDDESAKIWQKLFKQAGVDAGTAEIGSEKSGYERGVKEGERIFYYDASKNWWSREGAPDNMQLGEPGGLDSEVFYDFGTKHDKEYGEHCHPNCQCGRFLEIGNSVFMTYRREKSGFEHLPNPNVDFGGGLERIAAAAIDSPDVFNISLLKPIIEKLEGLSGKKYADHTHAMRVIADHLRGSVFLAVDGVVPSNKEQGYVMRRLLRRAIRYAFELGVEQNFFEEIVPVIAELYKKDFPEVEKNEKEIIKTLVREENLFRQTLRKGLREFDKILMLDRRKTGYEKIRYEQKLTGKIIFELYDTYGFPVELSKEEATKRGIDIADDADRVFEKLMKQQRERSQTATKGVFKGGLADHSEATKKLHTATHLMYEALRQVLGEHVVQRGSNVNADRTRFDFSHPQKVSKEQQAKVEKIVNEQIAKDLKVEWKEYPTDEAFKLGAKGAFGDKYGDKVKVYTIGPDRYDPHASSRPSLAKSASDFLDVSTDMPPSSQTDLSQRSSELKHKGHKRQDLMGKSGEKPFSIEICGGPHMKHTGQLAKGGKKFKITKEEASSAGVRRIKAVLA